MSRHVVAEAVCCRRVKKTALPQKCVRPQEVLRCGARTPGKDMAARRACVRGDARWRLRRNAVAVRARHGMSSARTHGGLCAGEKKGWWGWLARRYALICVASYVVAQARSGVVAAAQCVCAVRQACEWRGRRRGVASPSRRAFTFLIRQAGNGVKAGVVGVA